MGRGRAKAKQTKVARELKYHTPDTDLAALQRELAGSEDPARVTDTAEQPDLDDDLEDDLGYGAGDGERDDWAPRAR